MQWSYLSHNLPWIIYDGTRFLQKVAQARAQGHFINPVNHIQVHTKMQKETVIELDCMSIRKNFTKPKNFGKPKPKFRKFVRRQTDEDIYENMGSIFVLIMIGFLVFVHCMAQYERSLDLDYDADTCCSSCN